jgi:hypothetical protein
MRGMKVALAICLAALTACGGGDAKKKTTPKPPVKVAKKPPPPPPPACIKGGDAMGAIGGATGSNGGAEFCVSDGSSSECFKADLASGEYQKLDAPPAPQAASLEDSGVKVETTPTEVKVCAGEDCKTLAPKVGKADSQLVAVANATTAVVMVGNTESGKGVAEVWDVAKSKKVATIKYAKSDFKCGVPKLLGSTIYISASVCAGPAARAVLYSAKGKRIADVGGKEFGTYSEVAVQVKDNLWAFLEENGSMVALQDVATGKVQKTISLAPLWQGENDAAAGDDKKDGDSAPAMGNPGESALVRGGDNQLLVIAGSPSTGNVGVIDVASGEMKVTRAPVCK